MMDSVRSCLVLVALFAIHSTFPGISSGAEKRVDKRKTNAVPSRTGGIPEDPICNFDFMNDKYSMSDHTVKTTGIPPEIVLRNGQASMVSAKGQQVDIGITKIIYGELTGDNAYDAVVRMSTIIVGSEYGTDDLYVFRYAPGKPVLVGVISEYDMDAAFLKYFPGGVLWHGHTGIRIHDRVLEVEKNVVGSVNESKYNVKITFRNEGGKFAVSEAPAKVPYREFP
ncbi:MAG: hypothetical protein HGB02_08060 [Chlorobiaceae bacterium]|nr:hypothetical protein [Chlorobiaceae bacterium]